MIKFKSNKHIGCCSTSKKSAHLASPKTKEGKLPSKEDNEDQSEEKLLSKEKLE